MKADILESKAWESCRKVILGDKRLSEIDAGFYDLLDGVNEEMAVKLEEAYLEYGTRAIELAYLQGMEDGKKNR